MFPSLSSLSPQHALTLPAVAAINHLLAQEAWARALLMRHAGKDACIDAGLARLRMHVGRDGLLEAGQGDAPASVTIRVKPADLPLIAQDRTRALSYVKIEGDAEFANVISQLANGLRWDAERLKAYLADPDAVVPGGWMSPPVGLSEVDRAALAAFLLER